MSKIITIKDGKKVGLTSNPDLSFEQLKSIKEVDGALCYEVTDAQFTEAGKEYDVSIDNGVVSFTKGVDALTKEVQETQNNNEKIYKKIGECISVRNGKLEVNAQADTTTEDQTIETLKANLK